MKIILQTEAKTISDRELLENQQYLIGLINKIPGLSTSSNSNLRQQVKSRNSKTAS
ncbi:MAG: hypothetical protein ACFCU7_09755 [Pleurocapsa sp.]